MVSLVVSPPRGLGSLGSLQGGHPSSWNSSALPSPGFSLQGPSWEQNQETQEVSGGHDGAKNQNSVKPLPRILHGTK